MIIPLNANSFTHSQFFFYLLDSNELKLVSYRTFFFALPEKKNNIKV